MKCAACVGGYIYVVVTPNRTILYYQLVRETGFAGLQPGNQKPLFYKVAGFDGRATIMYDQVYAPLEFSRPGKRTEPRAASQGSRMQRMPN